MALIALLIIVPVASANVTVQIASQGPYAPLKRIEGNAIITFDQAIPVSSVLKPFIDGVPFSTLSISEYISGPDSYSFSNQPFGYNITSSGTNRWSFYPEQTFSYTVGVTGKCGGDFCMDSEGHDFCHCQPACGPPYPCDWSAQYPGSGIVSGSVRGNDYLKYIYDANLSITIPGSAFSLNWTVTDNSSTVDTVMFQACGGMLYGGPPALSQSGWKGRTLEASSFQGIPGTFDKETTIEAFNHESLFQVSSYGTQQPGGIYKTIPGGGLHYLQWPIEAYWNGSTGYIRINSYDATSTYVIYYLPPNGPKVCAYTNLAQVSTLNWQSSGAIGEISVNYNSPYSRTFGLIELQALAPNPGCPFGSFDCNLTTNSYSAAETFDPGNSVAMSWDPVQRKVTANSTSIQLSQAYSTSVPLPAFPGLRAPAASGNHTLRLLFTNSTSEMGSGSTQIETCLDGDGDGFCPPVDCDDSDPLINPTGTETCDGKDNNCNGKIDEDFWKAGSKLGSTCGVGICAGVFVCSPDGQLVVCNNRYYPGEYPEYCNDGQDNDCDGETDESVGLSGSVQIALCICKEGETRLCGSQTGACTQGLQTCSGGNWGACRYQVTPQRETCNNKDDNCDGFIDNIGDSREESKCQCYGGSAPVVEACNDIDDNCNGQIDEGVICCDDGDTRDCGSDLGICRKGTQSCSNGRWGTCSGIEPRQEICLNGIDENCNGRTDEDCGNVNAMCTNGIKDTGEEGVDCGGYCPQCGGIPFYLILTAVAIAIFVVIAVIQLRTLSPG